MRAILVAFRTSFDCLFCDDRYAIKYAHITTTLENRKCCDFYSHTPRWFFGFGFVVFSVIDAVKVPVNDAAPISCQRTLSYGAAFASVPVRERDDKPIDYKTNRNITRKYVYLPSRYLHSRLVELLGDKPHQALLVALRITKQDTLLARLTCCQFALLIECQILLHLLRIGNNVQETGGRLARFVRLVHYTWIVC